MSKQVVAILVRLSSEHETVGARVLARGNAAAVAGAVLDYDGEIGRTINVEEHEDGYAPHTLDQLVVEDGNVRRTPFGHEHVTHHSDDSRREWTQALYAARQLREEQAGRSARPVAAV